MLKFLAFTCFLILPTLVSARWIEDIVEIENPAVGRVRFSHFQHLEAVGNDCVLCHNRVFHIDTGKNLPVDMTDMEQGKSCGACHNGSKAFSVSDDCASCHPTRDISFKVEEGDALFSHEIHTDMYSCGDCHPDLFIADSSSRRISMAQMAEGASCGACHDGDTAFSVEDKCESCHGMQSF